MANQRCRFDETWQDLAKAFQAGGTSDGLVRGNGSEILQCNHISVHGHQKYGLWLMNAIII